MATAVENQRDILTQTEAEARAARVSNCQYQLGVDHTGDGFHQFKDPEDGEEYLYTNFEPYEAHRLFPCFDQPDIKATYELTVTAPPEWEIIANARQATEATASDGRRRHKFERTKPF